MVGLFYWIRSWSRTSWVRSTYSLWVYQPSNRDIIQCLLHRSGNRNSECFICFNKQMGKAECYPFFANRLFSQYHGLSPGGLISNFFPFFFVSPLFGLYLWNTVNSPLTDTLVGGQLYLKDTFSNTHFTSQSNLVLTHSHKQTLSRKRTRTLLKRKIGFFFCLCSLVSGHPMYDDWLSAMELVFNLQ